MTIINIIQVKVKKKNDIDSFIIFKNDLLKNILFRRIPRKMAELKDLKLTTSDGYTWVTPIAV